MCNLVYKVCTCKRCGHTNIITVGMTSHAAVIDDFLLTHKLICELYESIFITLTRVQFECSLIAHACEWGSQIVVYIYTIHEV